MKTYKVYKIMNTINGKIYIGQTERTIKARWNSHCVAAKNNAKFRFHFAIKKYGKDCWEIEELFTTNNYKEALKKEEKFISLFKSHVPKFGYNATFGGTGGNMLSRLGPEKYEEWKIKQSQRSMGYNNGNWSGLTDEYLITSGVELAMELKRVPLRRELIQNIAGFPKSFSKNRFGGKLENYINVLKQKTGYEYNSYIRTEEQKSKISQTLKGRTLSLEHRKNITEGLHKHYAKNYKN